MKILVTGATGKVGSRLVPRLLAKGYNVSILVRDAIKASGLADLGAKVIKGDLYNPATLPNAVTGMDAVIHLAALFRTFTDNEGIVKTNREGLSTRTLITVVIKLGSQNIQLQKNSKRFLKSQ